jgi:hypothetical protein
MIRKAITAVVAGTAVFGAGAYLAGGVGIAEVPSSISVYGGSANAAGVHAVGGTNVFENFSTGAIDNRYPYANVIQDVSPATAANSSYDDYGPLGADLYTNVPPENRPPNPPVDYARAQYPNPPGVADQAKKSPDGQSHYEAHARELQADALGFYAGGSTTTFKNMTAETHTIVGAAGSITTSTHSHVGSANFGTVQVSNTDVTTKIVSVNGKATVTDTVFAGNVTVSGQPVSVGDKGITVPGAPELLPGGISTVTPLIHVFTVAPVVHNDGKGGASIMATGLHVGVTQPGQGAMIPSQYVEYILGEGADSDFLVPASAATTSVDSSGGDSLSTGADNTPIGDAISQTISTPPNLGSFTEPAPINTVPHQKAVKAPLGRVRLLGNIKPPLAFMFFLWEALILGTASSLVWARRAKPPAA